MPDPITTLGLAKTTSEIIKNALEFAREQKNTDLAEKLIDLYRDFVGLVETNQDLRNDNQQLKTEIAELRKRPDIAAKLRHVAASGSYYLKQDDGKEEGPYCTVCWDVDGRLVRQTRMGLQTTCQYWYPQKAMKSRGEAVMPKPEIPPRPRRPEPEIPQPPRVPDPEMPPPPRPPRPEIPRQ